MKNKIEKSENYSEHYVDFSIAGISTSNDMFCLQFLSNKPTPYVENATEENGNANVQIAVGTLLHHECTLYMGKEQLEAFYASIGNALGKSD